MDLSSDFLFLFFLFIVPHQYNIASSRCMQGINDQAEQLLWRASHMQERGSAFLVDLIDLA